MSEVLLLKCLVVGTHRVRENHVYAWSGQGSPRALCCQGVWMTGLVKRVSYFQVLTCNNKCIHLRSWRRT